MDYESEHAPLRRCQHCRISMQCTAIHTRTYLFFPVSSTYWYQCLQCNRSIGIESNGGIAILAVSGAMLFGLGVLGLGHDLLGGIFLTLLGLVSLGYAAFLVRMRMKNERVPG